MELARETAVRMMYGDSANECFAILDTALELKDGHSTTDSSRGKFYYYVFDPLTTELQEGLAFGYSSRIKSITRLHSLPVSEDYVIDTLLRLRNELAVNDMGREESRFPSLFMQVMTGWLVAHEPTLAHKSTTLENGIINRADLTALGLDFMRQHYRRIRQDAIKASMPPSLLRLDAIAAEVAKNRTTDDDWGL